jgi:hypothetical protein
METPILDRLRSNAQQAAERARDAAETVAPPATPRRRRRPMAGDAQGTTRPARTSWQRHGTALPGWKDLKRTPQARPAPPPATPPDEAAAPPEAAEAPEGFGVPQRAARGFLARVSTVRFALAVLACAALFTLYVGHVHATQALLVNVQAARQTNRTLHLKHNRLKGDYDRATGPAVIARRAEALGLEHRLVVGPPLALPMDE